ncbi:MAG: methyltransferase domain protein [uncultured archaeon A07HB70]|nr:MAG: methyltransferase domain protein [uncultured archaeon A07HB70]
MTVDRDGVRDAARYLRSVRPVDPEEIHEYVEGRPHPALVRRVLREEAYDLALVEQPDGTFVPVGDDPVPPAGWAPGQFPERHEDALRDLLVDRLGPGWASGTSGDALRDRLAEVKERYYRRNPVDYDETTALAYAVYHLPGYWAATGYVLDRLAEAGLLPRRLRVLDVGAGVGGPALALFDCLPDGCVVDYHAVEASAAAADCFEALVDPPRGARTVVHREPIESFDAGGPYDLVLCANVLSELDDPVAVARALFEYVADDGTVVALAPADRDTATGLRAVERALVDEGPGTVFDPTLRLWPDAAPADDCWSFDVGRSLDPPGVQRDLDAQGAGGPGDGTFVNGAVRYAYALVRRDGTRRAGIRAERSRHARLGESERHVTKRVDTLVVKLSHDLGEGDANPLFLVGDGSQQTDHFAVLARESGLNAALREAPYAAVLALENVLVLWNDDEAAYNLVVDGEAVVDRAA